MVLYMEVKEYKRYCIPCQLEISYDKYKAHKTNKYHIKNDTKFKKWRNQYYGKQFGNSYSARYCKHCKKDVANYYSHKLSRAHKLANGTYGK